MKVVTLIKGKSNVFKKNITFYFNQGQYFYM